MIFDAIELFPPDERDRLDPARRALASFVDFVQSRFAGTLVYDARTFPFGRADLKDAWGLASTLMQSGIIAEGVSPSARRADEPSMKAWTTCCNDPGKHPVAGAALESDEQALMATLAEALERYIWLTQTDFFRAPMRARAAEMRMPHIPPARFAGFTDEQRKHGNRVLRDDAAFLWTRADSLISGKPIYVPAQVASAVGRDADMTEPLIRQRTTIGLATWSDRVGARLAGALEVIERDAYMIMWLNQITLPRISIESAKRLSPTLDAYIRKCERFGLKVHIIRMITDAPTYTIAVVVEDMYGHEPRFVIGLKAHHSLQRAIEKALTEALRARLAYQRYLELGELWDPATPVEKIGHRDRLYYWGRAERAGDLEFLVRGEEKTITPEPWDTDTPNEHLARLVAWCRSAGYECASIPLTYSKKNPTTLHIEYVIIPELQPTYLMEQYRMFGSPRLREIPKRFGYEPLPQPFADAPHPFT